MECLIDLVTFRKKNRITQQQVGDFLGISKQFISLVERGINKIPDEKLEKLYYDSGWDPTDLIPCFQRVITVWKEYNNEHGISNEFSPMENPDPFNLAPTTIYCLFYGIIGISDDVANAIINVMPNISREWLINGTGEMFCSRSAESGERLAQLEERVRALEETVNRLKEVFRM